MSMINIHRDKHIACAEFAALMEAVGWGRADDYDLNDIARSLASYPFVAHARTGDDTLVGYVSAFSDGAFSTLLGALVVHPRYQRQGVGSQLLKAVEAQFPGVPVYAKVFGDDESFYRSNGYRVPSRPMQVMFRHA